MNSILGEISTLRKGAPLTIDYKNSNRYRLVTIEPNETHTAYYFSSPIYNSRTRKAVAMKFSFNGEYAYTSGSNANITIGNSIRMENAEGYCILSLPGQISRLSETEIVCTENRLYPTTNGIAVRAMCGKEKTCTLSVEISKPFLEVTANGKYFALMSGRFRPFVSFSCIGTSDADGNIIAPADISYQKISDRKYTVSVSPCSSLGTSVLFEANLYEPKLFQDTTVESKHARSNNAFGSVGFIGDTKEFGEQWLYSKPDFTKMSELNGKKILRAVLHLPKLNNEARELTLSGVAARFCSFGSTWDNKIAATASFHGSQITNHYIDLNLMPVLADKQGWLRKSEGFILKAQKRNSGFSAVATGDNYFFPQILEVNYR